jgi:hypothetical protein
MLDSIPNIHIYYATFCMFAADFMNYLFLLLKTYRLILFTKIVFDQLPLFNPYEWPLSVVRITTRWYFRFWEKMVPTLKFKNGSMDISAPVALEFVTTLITSCYNIRIFFLFQAESYFY